MRLAPSQLTIREIIGQLMMPMLPDTADLRDDACWRRVEEDLATFGFGGDIVFRGDRTETPPYLEELQALSEVPLLFASDLERGAGQQLAGLTAFPETMALGAARDPDLAYQQGAITTIEARKNGLHWIFAPTLDLVTNPDNPIINVRGFGDEPRQVGLLGSAFIQGVKRYGGLSTAKHFPGHAETAVDSHATLPTIDVSRHRMEMNDLVPFRAAIQAGVSAVMVGHLAVPALDETGVPATMSRRIVSDLLREQLGFNGLVVTDAMMMGAVTERYDPGHAAVKALQAGCDVLLMPPEPQAVVDAVLRAIEEGALTKHRLLESVERLFDAKLEAGLWRYEWGDDESLPAELPDYEPAVAEIADASITLVGAAPGVLPLAADGSVCAIGLDDDADEATQRAWLTAAGERLPTHFLSGEADEAAIAEAIAFASGYDTVVVPLFSAVKAWKNRVDLPTPLASVPGRLKAAGKRVVAVSFTSPFLVRQFPEVDAYVCAYSPHPLSQRAAVRALFGEQPFGGRLPVDLGLAHA